MVTRRALGPSDTVLVTGGSSGIGAGLASALHARGATVVVAGRLQEVACRHPGREVLELDVADPASVARAAQELDARHPSLSVLVDDAGVQRLLGF